ncbi:MAG: SMI1/KNR4 family protein [Candidatus Avoscillospira sp.]
MNLEWGPSTPLEDESLIDKFEQAVGYRFPADCRQCIRDHGGAWVQPDGFDTQENKGYGINRILSAVPDHEAGSIWDLMELDAETAEVLRGYIPFADTPFGDFLCLDRKDDSVVYIDHETLEVEHAAPSFQAFLDGLHEDEDE